jgi:hypothetical protein
MSVGMGFRRAARCFQVASPGRHEEDGILQELILLWRRLRKREKKHHQNGLVSLDLHPCPLFLTWTRRDAWADLDGLVG